MKGDSSTELDLHHCALLLANEQLPPGWEMVASSKFARVACNAEQQLFYKEFLPRGPLEDLKALLRGSRATRARRNNNALLLAGFDAPTNIAWGKLPGSREYLFASAVSGRSITDWLLTTADLRRRRHLLHQFGTFIGRLHATGFIHGDLRTSNILARPGPHHFQFALIDNERNRQHKPAPGKQILRNLMQLNMHSVIELSRTDRMRFFLAWHCQMRDLSRPEARLLAVQAWNWAMRRLAAKQPRYAPPTSEQGH
ncbi:MAG: hypothetical protein HOC23_04035 [Halieaceae bacterium]|jgi:hypothetical protein|nr:hypothetical protein [Halieaceae bacterium]